MGKRRKTTRSGDTDDEAAFRAEVPMECAKCGLSGDATFNMDHIKPIKLGGSRTLSNLQWLCVPCHRSKTNREERVAGWEKRRQNNELLGKLAW